MGDAMSQGSSMVWGVKVVMLMVKNGFWVTQVLIGGWKSSKWNVGLVNTWGVQCWVSGDTSTWCVNPVLCTEFANQALGALSNSSVRKADSRPRRQLNEDIGCSKIEI